jgi:hypothetical protein
MTYDSFKYIMDGVMKQQLAVMETFCREMPDEEFNKIPVLSMSKEDKTCLERYGIVFYALRKGAEANDYKDFALYSTGSMPFKIKTTKP